MDNNAQHTAIDAPNFAAWHRDTLDRFASDAYVLMKQQADAIEQLRGDLRDAMQLLRQRSSSSG